MSATSTLRTLARLHRRIVAARALRDMARNNWHSTASDDANACDRALDDYDRRQAGYVATLELLASAVEIAISGEESLEGALEASILDARRSKHV
jgi:hypothetical protein